MLINYFKRKCIPKALYTCRASTSGLNNKTFSMQAKIQTAVNPEICAWKAVTQLLLEAFFLSGGRKTISYVLQRNTMWSVYSSGVKTPF